MSKQAIEGIEPKVLWERFYEISQVPRPSKKEEKILEYVRNFAKEKKLEFKEDNVGNIVIKIPATEGYENSPVVVMQGHVDMVCEKNKGTEHDFENDPIKLIRDGEWMTADGTTLGADNGIGVAAGLAVVGDSSFPHGPIEVLCTIDEETGLTGASNLQPGFVTGKMLLNMDSEEDGVFYVGCAGGQDTIGYFNIEFEEANGSFKPYELMVTGLKGGHSGLDIHQGRANAIKLLARLLDKLKIVDYQIAEISGGSLRNAIPREAEVTILIDPKNESQVKDLSDEFVKEALLEYQKNDGGLRVKFESKAGNFEKAYKKDLIEKLIDVLYALPHGIISMSPEIEGLVETSTNLATITLENGKLRIGTSQRSSVEPAKKYISKVVESVFKIAGADANVGDGYPGWQPNLDSELLKLAKKVYEEKYGNVPPLKAIHAGLECGILGDKYPGMEMISFGPTIEGAHSPDERVNIKDVEKFYDLVKGILTAVAKS